MNMYNIYHISISFDSILLILSLNWVLNILLYLKKQSLININCGKYIA